MAFLTINGNDYDVVVARMGKPERVGGSSRRTYNGGLRSTVKIEKRNWTFELLETPAEDYNVLYEDLKEAQQQMCGGDALLDLSAGVLCEGEIEGVEYIPDGADFLVTATIKLVEV